MDKKIDPVSNISLTLYSRRQPIVNTVYYLCNKTTFPAAWHPSPSQQPVTLTLTNVWEQQQYTAPYPGTFSIRGAELTKELKLSDWWTLGLLRLLRLLGASGFTWVLTQSVASPLPALHTKHRSLSNGKGSMTLMLPIVRPPWHVLRWFVYKTL